MNARVMNGWPSALTYVCMCVNCFILIVPVRQQLNNEELFTTAAIRRSLYS